MGLLQGLKRWLWVDRGSVSLLESMCIGVVAVVDLYTW